MRKEQREVHADVVTGLVARGRDVDTVDGEHAAVARVAQLGEQLRQRQRGSGEAVRSSSDSNAPLMKST